MKDTTQTGSLDLYKAQLYCRTESVVESKNNWTQCVNVTRVILKVSSVYLIIYQIIYAKERILGSVTVMSDSLNNKNIMQWFALKPKCQRASFGEVTGHWKKSLVMAYKNEHCMLFHCGCFSCLTLTLIWVDNTAVNSNTQMLKQLRQKTLALK